MDYNIKKALALKRDSKEVEENLPQVLYQLSSLISFSSYEEAIKVIAESNYGLLSEKFKKACNRMKNTGFGKALEEMKEETNSEDLKTAVEILLTGYETGEDISRSLAKTADSIMSKTLMKKQQAASTIIQKYTILLSSVLIVPALLGVIIALTSTISTSGLFGMSDLAKSGLLLTAITADYAYIVINSLVSSVFLARISNEKNFVKYLPLAFVSLAAFTIAKSIKVL